MSKYKKLIESYVSEYSTGSGKKLWKAQVPSGTGGTFRKQGFPDKILAVEWAKAKLECRQAVRGLKLGTASQQSVAAYAEIWLNDKRGQGLRTQTIMRYEDELRLRIIPFFNRIKLKDLSKSHFFGFLRELQGSGLSTTSANFSSQLLKGIIKQAELEDVIPYTGIQNIPLPKKARPELAFLADSQIETFLAAIQMHPCRALWTLALFTGMRSGEIAGLKWDCVHLDRERGGHVGFIEVCRTVEQKTYRLVETTKNGDRRTIPILPQVKEVLEQQARSDGFVFGGDTPLDASHLARDIRRECRRLGLPQVTFHGLRHSFCSWAESQGINRSVTSKIMGHRSQHTTDRYSHANEETIGRAVGDWLQDRRKTFNLRIVEPSNRGVSRS